MKGSLGAAEDPLVLYSLNWRQLLDRASLRGGRSAARWLLVGFMGAQGGDGATQTKQGTESFPLVSNSFCIVSAHVYFSVKIQVRK